MIKSRTDENRYPVPFKSRLTCAVLLFFFFNDTATTEIYTLSLHDALPISSSVPHTTPSSNTSSPGSSRSKSETRRSEEHTSELQSRPHLVCRLLLEKKNGSRRAAAWTGHPANPVIGSLGARAVADHQSRDG